MMTPRASEVVQYIRDHNLNANACFGPLRRGSVRPFIGGGIVTESEYRAIIAEFFTPPVVADGAADARLRAIRAADNWRR